MKVHLQLRGFSVFLDIERLNAGKFDEGLLTSIAQSKNFILVLTPDALERCKGDNQKKDWVHKVSILAKRALSKASRLLCQRHTELFPFTKNSYRSF